MIINFLRKYFLMSCFYNKHIKATRLLLSFSIIIPVFTSVYAGVRYYMVCASVREEMS